MNLKKIKIIILILLLVVFILKMTEIIHLSKLENRILMASFLIIFILNNFNRFFKTKKNEKNITE